MKLSDVIEKIFKFFYDIFSHEIAFVILVIVIALLIFLLTIFIERLKRYFHSILQRWKSYLAKRITTYTMKHFKNYRDRKKEIRQDIDKHIDMLNDPEKQYVAMQYLLQYPCPKGYISMMEMAVKENNKGMRNKLICLLCENAKKLDWDTY